MAVKTECVCILKLSLPARCRESKCCFVFTQTSKFSIFAPQGRLVSPIHVKFGMAKGHVGPLGCAKFYLNRRMGGNAAPKISKISTFAGTTDMTDFYKFLGIFVRPTILH